MLFCWQTAILVPRGKRGPSVQRLYRDFCKGLGVKTRRSVDLDDPDMKEILEQSRERVRKAREEAKSAGG
jgi:hypothetical protein